MACSRWRILVLCFTLLHLFQELRGQEPFLKLDYQTEFQEYPLDATEVHLQARVRAVDESDSRSPWGLTAVVDTSGSMTGPRIEMMRNTLKFLALESLQHKGAMGIVSFSDDARELFQFQEISEERYSRLLEAIDLITADGRTDLSDGLVVGLDQIRAAVDTSAKCRTQEVFVFSDGDPNQGVTKRKKLLKLLDENRENRVRVTTFPFGAAANYPLLQDIADKGEGEAYVIEGMAQMADGFGMAVSRLQTTVAQNIKLTFTPLNGARIKLVRHAYRVVEKGEKYRVVIPNLSLEEDYIPYLELEIGPGPAGHQEVMLIELFYEDTTKCEKVQEESLIVSILRKENPDQGQPSTVVIENLCRLTMGGALELKEGTIDAETTAEVATEMERIADVMGNQTCCNDSDIIPHFIEGADDIALELRISGKPTELQLALFREVGDTLMKGRTSLPSIDTNDYHFMGFFETSFSKQKRKEATDVIVGGGSTPTEDPPDDFTALSSKPIASPSPSPSPPFPPFPPFTRTGRKMW